MSEITIEHIKKRLAENKKYYFFNVDRIILNDIKNFLMDTPYHIFHEDNLIFTVDIFLKQKGEDD